MNRSRSVIPQIAACHRSSFRGKSVARVNGSPYNYMPPGVSVSSQLFILILVFLTNDRVS